MKFSNNGVIDPTVWSTFGVSVKENDNPIGMFGTGLKYAIAVLMREGRAISIRSGGERYVFGTDAKEVRGQTFMVCTCNGEHLPYTTELGKGWELWQAYRELYSNCKDEGGWIGDEGDTVIDAELDDICHDSVFLETNGLRCLSKSAGVSIYDKQSNAIYCKGVRVMELPKTALFTYDYDSIQLTEDRTVKDIYRLQATMAGACISSTSEEFAARILRDTKEFWEEGVDLDWSTGYSPSDAMKAAVSAARTTKGYVHPTLYKAVRRSMPDVVEEIEANQRQSLVLDKALSFLERMGEPCQYDVKIVTGLGGNVMGAADTTKMRVLLSGECLDRGVKYTVSTIYEECLHLSKGLKDCTYDMQTYLFDKIISMAEERLGEAL